MIKQVIHKAFSFLILSTCLWGIARFCHHQTAGFSLSKIQNSTFSHPHLTALLTQEQEALGKALLCQKFTYLGRGLQSFSFLSEDGQTVLKLFNNRCQRRLFFGLFSKPVHKAAFEKLIHTFESYHLAWSTLQEETALLYFHPCSLEKKDLPLVTIVDRLHIAHLIDLNRIGFVLQKKATLVYPYLEECMREENVEKARRAIFSLVSLLHSKLERGIKDQDPLIRTNFGFVGEMAIQVDIGPLSCEKEPLSSLKQKEELQKMTLSMKHWIENNQPRLLPFLDEALLQVF